MKRVDALKLALAALRGSSELLPANRPGSAAEGARQRLEAIAAIEQELACPPDLVISRDFSPADMHSIRRAWAAAPPGWMCVLQEGRP